MKLLLSELVKKFNFKHKIIKDIEIIGISSIEEPKPNTFVLLSKSSFFKLYNISSEVVNIAPNNLKLDTPSNINLIFSTNPKVDLAILLNFFYPSENFCEQFTIVDDDKFSNIEFGGNCYIGTDSSIGQDSRLGNNVVIGCNVKIGKDCNIAHNVSILNDCIIGNNVTISAGTVIGSEGFGNVRDDSDNWIHVRHTGAVVIHDNVQIGSNCTIDRGTINNTVISNGVIIDNLVHIAHNVEVGEKTAIAAKVGIAGSSHIGKRNMIGGMVGIVDHITTADDVIISATSTVNKDIMEPGIYTGIMPISKHSSWKRIAFWITKLDKIVKKFNIKKI